MEYKRVQVGLLSTNCYIIYGKDSAMLIDPAFEADKIEKALNGCKVTDIVITHGHLDHFYELNYFVKKYGPKVYIHKADEIFLTDFDLNSPAGFFGGMTKQHYAADATVEDRDTISFGELCFTVIHTPGHTPGSICLLYKDLLFCGDTLFNNSVGRTDFPQSSLSDLADSINKLMKLDDNIKILPGHGFASTIGFERENNIFVRSFR